MLLVANLANTKLCKKTGKWLKPWHIGTHLRVLNEYQHDRVSYLSTFNHPKSGDFKRSLLGLLSQHFV